VLLSGPFELKFNFFFAFFSLMFYIYLRIRRYGYTFTGNLYLKSFPFSRQSANLRSFAINIFTGYAFSMSRSDFFFNFGICDSLLFFAFYAKL